MVIFNIILTQVEYMYREFTWHRVT